MNQAPAPKPHIRWMIRRDMTRVTEIDKATAASPWSEEDFIRHLRQRNMIGMVAEIGDHVVGFMVYERNEQNESHNSIVLHKLAVDPEYAQQGIFDVLVDKIKSKLSSSRITHVDFLIREDCVEQLNALKTKGFFAEELIKEGCEETDRNLIRMRYPRPEISAERPTSGGDGAVYASRVTPRLSTTLERMRQKLNKVSGMKWQIVQPEIAREQVQFVPPSEIASANDLFFRTCGAVTEPAAAFAAIQKFFGKKLSKYQGDGHIIVPASWVRETHLRQGASLAEAFQPRDRESGYGFQEISASPGENPTIAR